MSFDRWAVASSCVLLSVIFLPAGDASAQVPIPVPSFSAASQLPDDRLLLSAQGDGMIRTEDLNIGVSRTGKRVHALSLKTGELHTVQTDAASRDEIRVFASPAFAAFKLKSKVFAISSAQGGWKELDLGGEPQFVNVTFGGVEVHVANRHCFFLKNGNWVVMDLDAE